MSDRSEPAAPDPITYEARLEAVLEGISDAFYALDADWRYVIFNKAAERYFGVAAEVILGHRLWDVFPSGRGTPFEVACNGAMNEGRTSVFETTSALRPDRVLELRVAPVRGGGIAISFSDVTERRRAEDALKAALARSEEILESIPDAFYALDAEGRFTYVNSVAERWWGLRREDMVGRSVWDVFPGAVGSGIHDAHLQAAKDRRVVQIETQSPLSGRWVDLSVFPSGEGLSVYFRDIGERRDGEERQRLLVNELNHRVKNTLATVQAIASQSLQGVPDEHRERFTGRLMALAQANDLLLQQDWGGVTLRSLAEQVARPHGDGERFSIEGPTVELAPKTAMAMALALHELATNAAKYGALTTPAGRVALSWTTEGDKLHIVWRETGGPTVMRPDRCGFGTRLIERGLASELKAKVVMDYRPEGLVCEVRAPLPAA